MQYGVSVHKDGSSEKSASSQIIDCTLSRCVSLHINLYAYLNTTGAFISIPLEACVSSLTLRLSFILGY